MQKMSWMSRIAVLAVLAAMGRAEAAVYTVNSLSDSNPPPAGVCTLRRAVELHNDPTNTLSNPCGSADAAADTILFSVAGTITLDATLGTLPLAAPDATVDGGALGSVTLSGGDAVAIFTLSNPLPGAVTVRRLVLEHALGPAPSATIRGGGAIAAVMGGSPGVDLTVEDAILRNNIAPDSGSIRGKGAAIANLGRLTLRRAVVASNVASEGAVYQQGAVLVEDSTFAGNQGTSVAGLLLFGQDPNPSVVRRSLFRGQDAGEDGGPAAILASDADLTIENSTFTASSSSLGQVVTARGVEFPGTLLLRNCTFHDNAAFNNTNTASAVVAVLNDVGVTGGSVTLTSNLFHDDESKDLYVEPSASLGTATYNLFQSPPGQLPGGVVCAAGTAGGANLCQVVDAGVLPLQANGGVTETLALAAGSVALDAGSNPGNLATDQRGSGYPRVVGSAADIGAFERLDSVVQIPMLGDWGMVALAAGLAAAAARRLRRRDG